MMLFSTPVFATYATTLQELTVNASGAYSARMQYDITITTTETERVQLLPYHPLHVWVDNPSYFIVTNSTQTFPFFLNIDVPGNIPAGQYDGILRFYSTQSVTDVPIHVVVQRYENFTVEYPNFLNITSGAKGTFYMNVTNTGNTNPLLRVNVTSPFLKTENETLLITSRKIWVEYDMPDSVSGIETASVYINGKKHLITFYVRDVESPEIKRIDMEANITADESYTVKIEASDNVEIKTVKMNAFGRTYEGDKQGTRYFIDFVADKAGEQEFDFEVCDWSGNCAVKKIIKEIVYYQNVWVASELRFPKTQVKTPFKKLLLTTNKEINNVTIEMGRLLFWYGGENLSNISEQEVDVVLKWIGNERILRSDITNEMSLRGDVFIEVTAQSVGRAEFSLTVNFPEGIMHGEKRGIDAYADFDVYSVPEPFAGELFGFPVNCTPYDLGNFQDSYVMCDMKMGIDTDPSKLDVLDIAEKERYTCRIEKGQIQARLDGASNMNLFLYIVLFSLGVFALFKWKFPGLKFKL